MRVLFIQHDHVSPLGPVGERFVERGIEVVTHLVVPADDFYQPNVESEFPDLGTFDYLVPLGAAWSVYDEEKIGLWVKPELDLLREADSLGMPVFGICFGGQLLAETHGGTVEKSPYPEIGWTEIEADHPALAGPWFEWHYDRWNMPREATEIARNRAASQAWTLRRNLAVQFHPELDSHTLHGWLHITDGVAEATAAGIDYRELQAATAQNEVGARVRAHQLVDYFLDEVAKR
jgi:GMP synthase-like glutamine amidotransferase